MNGSAQTITTLKPLLKKEPMAARKNTRETRELPFSKAEKPKLSPQQILAKVQRAAASIGLEEVILTTRTDEWYFCDAYIIPQSHYANDPWEDGKHCLGYVSDGKFLRNYKAFSPDKDQEFNQALQREGLPSEAYNPVRTPHYHDSDFAQEKRRATTALYK